MSFLKGEIDSDGTKVLIWEREWREAREVIKEIVDTFSIPDLESLIEAFNTVSQISTYEAAQRSLAYKRADA